MKITNNEIVVELAGKKDWGSLTDQGWPCGWNEATDRISKKESPYRRGR